MAKIIDAEDIQWGGSPGSRYPWDEWFDGKARILAKGEDFTSQISSFRTTVYECARRRGLKVRIATVDNGKGVAVQVVGKIEDDDGEVPQE